ncbi:MAG: ACP S-malonyltransferase [Gammaproteobacteria bacterium]
MSLGIVFPGQGSQSVGMLDALAGAHAVVRETIAEATDALGYDLGALIHSGPEEELVRTERTQPAMLLAGVAVWRAWRVLGGGEPAMVAGHSLGEYTALVCSGALGFADAVRIVAARGRFMQEAVPQGQGAMAAIMGLEDAVLERLCADQEGSEVVACANYNAPAQVVIAGHASAVERVMGLAQAQGAKRAVRLPVSAPFHCALMKPAAERLAQVLQSVNIVAPRIPVIHNVDARSRVDANDIRAALVEQAFRPVRWVECVRALHSAGVTRVVEFGPGKVLTGLCKRIERGLECAAAYDPDTLSKAQAAA